MSCWRLEGLVRRRKGLLSMAVHLCAVGVAVLVCVASLPAVAQGPVGTGFLQNGVTAHRGNSSECPENTLAAFRSGIQAGADWIELDVYRTRDGKLVVIHDPRTKRVGDVDLDVRQATCAELMAVDVATLYRKQRGLTLTECPAVRIPLLEDVLKLVVGQRKTRVSIQPKMDCVADVMALVDRLGARAWVGFNDGNLAYMSQVKRLVPEVPVFWDRYKSDVEEDVRVARLQGFETLVLHHSQVTPQCVESIQRAGLKVGVWTVNDRETMRRLLELGVDRLYTDFPARLLSVKAGSGTRARPPQVVWIESGVLAAPEAFQAAAADEQFVYAIASAQIAKYERATGRRVAVSTGDAKHLNSGFFWNGRLYCAHSNFPQLPERSEIKTLDPATMRLATVKDFGSYGGSLTWCVRHAGHWWCNFARYGRDNAGTFLVKFDDRWCERARWTYPSELIAQLGSGSLSGGLWRDGFLLVTDHDRRVLYRLRLPRQGTVLELVDRLASPFAGQGIAEDLKTGGLVGIDRARRQVVFAKPRKAVRLLTIGNSFSRNATRLLGDLVTAAGHELIHHEAFIPGSSFAKHWDKVLRYEKDPTDKQGTYGVLSLKQELLAEPWDFATIQQYSLTSHDLPTYWPCARKLRDYVAQYAPQAELLVHQTWAYRCDDPRFTTRQPKPGEPTSQKAMYQRVTVAYEAIAAELGLRMIPVGDALYQADTDAQWGYRPDRSFDVSNAVYPALPKQLHSLHVGWRWLKDKTGKPRLKIDGHHANLAGEYLGACVFYEMLFDASVVDVAYVPQDLDPAYARFLRETAHRAVQKRHPNLLTQGQAW
jgi:glycerophosphoryl diester phosphodiesterase